MSKPIGWTSTDFADRLSRTATALIVETHGLMPAYTVPVYASPPSTGDEALNALRAIVERPNGCVYCDSGVLRTPPKYPHARPDQGHEAECGFALAASILAKATS